MRGVTRRRGGIGVALVFVAAWALAAASSSVVGVWLAIGGAAIVLGAATLLRAGGDVRAMLVPSGRLVLVGLAAGLATIVATYAIYPSLVSLAPSIVLEVESLYAAFRAPSLTIAALALVPIILGEELVWRGAVQGSLAQRLGPRGGLAAAAGLYALATLPVGSPLLALASLGLGLSWGALRTMTSSLVPSLIAHATWNAVVLLWWPLG